MSLEAEHRAQEAKRLLNEPVLADALEDMRMEALEALAEVDATNVAEVMKFQAMIKAVAGIVTQLNRYTVMLPESSDVGEDSEPSPGDPR